jgi:hypothetical protein
LSSALKALNIECDSVCEYQDVGMRIAFMSKGSGKTSVELLEPNHPSSPIAKDDDGLHHIGIRVDNIEEAYAKLKSSDQHEVLGDISQGAHSRIFFFRIAGQSHTLFECVE